MASSQLFSGGAERNVFMYQDRPPPALRSEIVKPNVESDYSPAASPTRDDTDFCSRDDGRLAVADCGNGHEGRTLRRRRPVARFRQSSLDPRSPYFAELREDGPVSRVMDRERGGNRDGERYERVRDIDRSKGFNNDTGLQEDAERPDLSGGLRDNFRAIDRNLMLRDDVGKREPDSYGPREGGHNDKNAADMPRHQDYDNKIEDRDRGRDKDRGTKRGRNSMSVEAYDDDSRRWRDMGRDRGRRRRRRKSNNLSVTPPLYSIHNATVHSICPFGIFVRMAGYQNHGLVHLSQVSDHEVTTRDDSNEAKVKALSAVASEGEKAWVKVISKKVEEDGNIKVGCSMRFISQADGRDLDPNNNQLNQHQSRPSWPGSQKLKMEAIYNVQCEPCGGYGNSTRHCYTSGEKACRLFPDDDDTDLIVQNGIKGKEQILRGTSKKAQPSNLLGIPAVLLATGSVGRGRAMEQPAWMKHGVGIGGAVAAPTLAADQRDIGPALPERVTNKEESLAVVARLKEEKQRRKRERRRRREKRHIFRQGMKEKHKRRHHDKEGHKRRHSGHKKLRA